VNKKGQLLKIRGIKKKGRKNQKLFWLANASLQELRLLARNKDNKLRHPHILQAGYSRFVMK
jgi:hypothetical protein